MTAVCQALGLARSNVHALRGRSPSWVDRRTDRTPHGDDQLLDDIREQITELPSYGYRRACALVNRKRASSGAPRVNPKRVYRVMASNGLLLPKAPRRPRRGSHERHPLVLRRLRDQVRLGANRHRHVRQGLL